MVERTSSEGVEEFEGQVKLIEVVPDTFHEGQNQYHIGIVPNDETLLKDTKTGMFHEWLSITKTSTPTSVSEGSKLDNYLKEIEVCIKETKKCELVSEVIEALKGKNIRFVKKVIGREYDGHKSKPSFVPQAVLN